jgi:hypothetical protein
LAASSSAKIKKESGIQAKIILHGVDNYGVTSLWNSIKLLLRRTLQRPYLY